jgi:hypothetical protein
MSLRRAVKIVGGCIEKNENRRDKALEYTSVVDRRRSVYPPEPPARWLISYPVGQVGRGHKKGAEGGVADATSTKEASDTPTSTPF